MNISEIIASEDQYLARVYARKPIAIERGKGAVVYDANGKEYIDCAAGYGTCIVGHAHPKVSKAIAEQASKLISCHGSTYNGTRAELLSKIATITPPDLNRIYLSNSGAEAIETAIKIARKSTGKRKIVAMKGGYHGKTHGALSATWDSKYRKNFEPLVPDFLHVPYGNFEAAKSAISNEVAAVLVEPIQGEGGIRVPPPDWLGLLKDLCEDSLALLVADEVQTGFGRTGKMFACQHFGITPDILCFAKGVASGLPIGVTVASGQVMGSLAIGEHTSTYGGNPVVCAAASATIEVLLEERLIDNSTTTGNYLKGRLQELQSQLRIVREVRGMGLMLGVEMRFDVLPILQSSLEQGLLLLDAGRNVLRFLPPLMIQQPHVDRLVGILHKTMESEQVAKLPRSIAQTDA